MTSSFLRSAALALTVLAIGVSDDAAAQQTIAGDTELGPVFLLSLGGKLYDDIWTVTELTAPDGANPAYPPDPNVSEYDTWRCVSCHGWDYRGSEGERGSAVAGLVAPSLRPLVGEDPLLIVDKIADDAHPFPGKDLPDLAAELLAAFISSGQRSQSDFTGGRPEYGRAIFEGACINCHQIDGLRYLRGEPGDKSSLGWLVRNRPEQSLHKILNGVPAQEMLALQFLADEQIADLLAYLATLDPP